jgi:hypothetical protein
VTALVYQHSATIAALAEVLARRRWLDEAQLARLLSGSCWLKI